MQPIRNLTIYCIMQENGIRQWLGRRLSLKECQEKFNCTTICSFEKCPCLKMVRQDGTYFNLTTDTFLSKLKDWEETKP